CSTASSLQPRKAWRCSTTTRSRPALLRSRWSTRPGCSPPSTSLQHSTSRRCRRTCRSSTPPSVTQRSIACVRRCRAATCGARASERAVKLLQSPVTGLPEGLAAEQGLAESGLSEFGVPVQAFAAEACLLAQPVSIETVSTTQHEGIEDRMTLAPLGARRLGQMVELGERLAAVELVVAAQALDLRNRPQLGAVTGAAYERVRQLVPATARGEAPPQDLEPVRQLVRSGGLGVR